MKQGMDDADTVRPAGKTGGAGAENRGLLESLGADQAWGWYIWKGRQPPSLGIRCGEKVYAANVRWVPRPDVTADPGMTPGFQFRVPYEVVASLVHTPALAAELAVLIDGEPLPHVRGGIATAPARDEWEALPFESMVAFAEDDAAHAVQGWADAPFRLKVRVEDVEVPRAGVALLCNGQPLDATISVAAETRMVAGEAEFVASVVEFELPGLLWSSRDTDGNCALQFRIADRLIPSVPVVLSLEYARKWIEQQVKYGPHESYDQLVSLEHAGFVGELMAFDESVATYFEWAARNHGLKELTGVIRGAEGAAAEAQAEVDLGSMLVWQTLRDFNLQLPEWSGREEQLLASIEEMLPAGEQRTAFYTSITPYFCRLGRFEAIRQRMPATQIDKFSQSRDVYEATLVVPFLVADGRIDRATDILYAVAGQPGWLATDALAVASRLAAEQSRVVFGNEKFAYALIALLDKLSQDYWSRVHDVQLMEALVAWLQEPVYWTRWLWRDLVAAALRTYGLSSAFWERLEPVLAAGDPLHVELREGQARFNSLKALVDGLATSAPLPISLREDLAFFARFRNREVANVLRELVTARLLGTQDTAAALADLPLQDLLALGGEESVRLAALPVANDAGLLDRLPTLPARLAQMYGNLTQSPRYDLQCSLGEVVSGLAEVPDSRASATMSMLLRNVEGFGDAASECLSVDILATAWRRFSRHPSATSVASAFARHALQGVQVQGEWPAQPLLAGLANFRAGLASGSDRVAETYLRQIEIQLEQRFQARRVSIEQALTPPSTPRLRSVGSNDTLVVIYSCRKYLDTRIRAIRESWLLDLQARKIPYVILVGDGDDTLDGDLLQLAVSDRYEDLPAKSLAMIRWVAQNTDYQYMLKIDDDCLLNVDAYFGSLSYRKFHYYGRILRRPKGTMDRVWHQSKSQGERARSAIDKSPEPSIYADGGGGYSLSRLAMLQVLEQSETPAGQRLAASSFMEDKLVGDLLNWAGFRISNEDYYTLVRRRFGTDATPVCVWDNNFAPSASSPAKLAHLDTADHMAPVRDRMRERGLWPKKVWPTHSLPTINLNSNQLELLTPVEKARPLLEAPFFVVAVMRNEEIMLPHFLAHYRKLGVTSFIIVDNLSDDGTRERLLEQPDVVLYSADTEYRLSTFGVAWQQAVLANHCVGKWALVADADELLVYRDCEHRPISDFVREVAEGGADVASVHMVDMYPAGDLDEADFQQQSPFEAAPWFDREPLQEWRLTSGAYSNAANHVSALRHRLLPSAEPHAFTAQKFCLVRYAPWMRFCAGLHNVANARVSPVGAWFAHFKYHAGFKLKVEDEVARKQHFGDAQEYRKYLSLLTEGRGRFGVEGVSRRYVDSSTFVALQGGAAKA